MFILCATNGWVLCKLAGRVQAMSTRDDVIVTVAVDLSPSTYSMWRPPAGDYAVVYCVPLRHRRPLRPAVPPVSVGRTTVRVGRWPSSLFCSAARSLGLPLQKMRLSKGLLMASRYWVFFGHLSKFDYALAVIVRKRCGRVRDGRTDRGASSWLADLAPPAGVSRTALSV